jgi:molybdopterin converting factor subunit 1
MPDDFHFVPLVGGGGVQKTSNTHTTINTDKSTIQIKVLFFAAAREAVGGITEVMLSVPTPHTTHTVRQQLAQQYPRLASAVLDEDSITLAVNEEFVPAGQSLTLQNNDTVALIPPISGG